MLQFPLTAHADWINWKVVQNKNPKHYQLGYSYNNNYYSNSRPSIRHQYHSGQYVGASTYSSSLRRPIIINRAQHRRPKYNYYRPYFRKGGCR